MPVEQRFIASQRVIEATGADRNAVPLSQAQVRIEFTRGRRALVVIEHPGITNHAKSRFQIELVCVGVNHAVAGNADEQSARSGHAACWRPAGYRALRGALISAHLPLLKVCGNLREQLTRGHTRARAQDACELRIAAETSIKCSLGQITALARLDPFLKAAHSHMVAVG